MNMKEFSKIIHAKGSHKWQGIIHRLVSTGCNNTKNFQEHICYYSFISCTGVGVGILKNNMSVYRVPKVLIRNQIKFTQICSHSIFPFSQKRKHILLSNTIKWQKILPLLNLWRPRRSSVNSDKQVHSRAKKPSLC